MAGITSTVSVEKFRADWLEYVPIAELCVRYQITKDQVIRLRHAWGLPPRTDCRRRYKPRRSGDPTPQQIEAACLRIQATWDARTREHRRVSKSSGIYMREICMSDLVERAESEDE